MWKNNKNRRGNRLTNSLPLRLPNRLGNRNRPKYFFDLIFNIDILPIEELKNEISVEDAGVYIPTDGIAKDNDAFSLVEWVETRNLLINDLVKVKIFFWPLTIFLIILTSLFS